MILISSWGVDQLACAEKYPSKSELTRREKQPSAACSFLIFEMEGRIKALILPQEHGVQGTSHVFVYSKRQQSLQSCLGTSTEDVSGSNTGIPPAAWLPVPPTQSGMLRTPPSRPPSPPGLQRPLAHTAVLHIVF